MNFALASFTLASVALASVAHATTVAIMPVEAPDRQAEGRQLLDTLRGALSKNGLTDKGDVRLNVPEARISFSCFDETPACMAQVGQILEADELIWAKLEPQGPDLKLTLSWVSVSSSSFKRPREQVIIPAGVPAGPFIQRAGVAFIANQPLPKPVKVSAKSRVTFTSQPDGATVMLDDARMGDTPTTIELVRGDYRLEVKLEGYATERRTVQVKDAETIKIMLTPAQAVDGGTAVGAAGSGGASWKLWTGVGALVGATVLTGLSASFAEDGNNAVRETDALCEDLKQQRGLSPSALCPGEPSVSALIEEGESANAKHIGLAVGAGVLAVGGAWLIFDYLTDDGDGPSVSVTPTLGGAAFIGRF